HGNLMASIASIAATYQLTPRDRSLIVMPLFHVHGLLGATLSTLHTGGAVVVPGRFSAGAFWEIASRYAVTWYSAVPTIHQILLGRADQDNAPRGGLRFIRSCSSALAPAVFHQLEGRFCPGAGSIRHDRGCPSDGLQPLAAWAAQAGLGGQGDRSGYRHPRRARPQSTCRNAGRGYHPRQQRHAWLRQ